MRPYRFKSPDQTTVYHCTSHFQDFVHYLGDVEKEFLQRLIHEYARFSGVEVLSYCLMDNHFHVVVEVPPRPEVLPTAEEVIGLLEQLTCVSKSPKAVARRFKLLRDMGSVEGEKAYLAEFHRRMWDISEYMKVVKQQFSRWYNRVRKRKGTIWDERFHSVLVEPGQALLTVSAYVNLNPVRAGMVPTPELHPWNSYTRAMEGAATAKAAIQKVMSAWAGRTLGVEESLREYRCQMYLQGEERRDADGRVERLGLARAEVVAMVAQRGAVTMSEYLGCRVRYFTGGLALGSQKYVDGIFQKYRSYFGARRKEGPRELAGLPPRTLYTLRPYHRGALS